MTQRDRDLDEILRRALHAAAGSVQPADDGLDRIQARLTTPRPLLVAWVIAAWAAVARRTAGALASVSTWRQSVPGAARGPGHARPSPWRLRPTAVLAMAAFVVAAGVIALTPLPQQAMTQTASLIHSLSGGQPRVPAGAVGGGVNGQGTGLAPGGASPAGAVSSGPGGQRQAAAPCTAAPSPAALAPATCPGTSAPASSPACPSPAVTAPSSPAATPGATPSGSAAPAGCPGPSASPTPTGTSSPSPTADPTPTTSPSGTASTSPSPATPSPGTTVTGSAGPTGEAGQTSPASTPSSG